jgi:hypothetical protein
VANSQLHQHLASEPNIKTKERTLAKETENTFHKKQSHFDGLIRTYTPKEEEGEQFPEENKPLVTTVHDKLDYYLKSFCDAVNHAVLKEETNTDATAELIYDGKTIDSGIHATSLLNLENKLKSLRPTLLAIPTLDPSDVWTWNKDQGYYETKPVTTLKAKKVQSVLVKYQATDKHPAQTELVTEDKTIGSWKTIKLSGAIPPREKSEILGRHDKWELAVKDARQRANNAVITRRTDIGDVIIKDILTGK